MIAGFSRRLSLPMKLSVLLPHGESGDRQPYSGQGEVAFAAIACLLWFSASLIWFHLDGETWTLLEQVIEASAFVVFAGLPIFCLATKPGEKFTQYWLLKRHGLWFQVIGCGAIFFYILLVKSTAHNVSQFRFLAQIENLVFAQNFWLNTGVYLLGLFAALRIPFLVLTWRQPVQSGPLSGVREMPHPNRQLLLLTSFYLIYLVLSQTALVSPALKTENSGYAIALVYLVTLGVIRLPITQKTSPNRFMVFDLLLSALCIYSIFSFTRPIFRFGIFIPVDLFIVVIIYGIGLGREHFGYSFQVRPQDVRYVAKMIAIAILLLVPAAFGLGFVSPKLVTAIAESGGLLPFLLKLFSFAILFSFRVGVFEEILFRAGLLIFIRDQLFIHDQRQNSGKGLSDRRRTLIIAAVLCSIIFGLAHLGNSPSTDSFISFWQYKFAYLCLATLASLFYSLAFVETNRLWSSIVIHGFVDTTAVVLLGAELIAPF
jgi:membrane protease YdiL (CAAX protease family)